MDEDARRQGDPRREEQRRPVDGMKALDVFADDMSPMRILHPEALIERAIASIVERGDVVAQGIKPDVHDLLRVAGHGDAPITRACPGARDAEILQPPPDEAERLVFAR